jgi:hypothetical protein
MTSLTCHLAWSHVQVAANDAVDAKLFGGCFECLVVVVVVVTSSGFLQERIRDHFHSFHLLSNIGQLQLSRQLGYVNLLFTSNAI